MPERNPFPELPPEYDATISVSYSSVRLPGLCEQHPGEDKDLHPSRMTSLVAAAATLFLRHYGISDIPGLFATEQSYRHDPRTTADLLIEQQPDLLPAGVEPVVLPAGEDRSLCTSIQARKLAEYMLQHDIHHPLVFGMGFHAKRVMTHLRAYAGKEIEPTYIRAEDVIRAIPDDERSALMKRIGFSVDFETVMHRGVFWYAVREWFTSLPTYVDRKGRITAWLAQRRKTGRHDELLPDGRHHMDTTDPPKWL